MSDIERQLAAYRNATLAMFAAIDHDDLDAFDKAVRQLAHLAGLVFEEDMN